MFCSINAKNIKIKDKIHQKGGGKSTENKKDISAEAADKQNPTEQKPSHSAPKTEQSQMSEQIREMITKLQRGANFAATELHTDDTLAVRLIYNAFGQLLYRIGLQTEYFVIRTLRLIREIILFIVRSIALVINAVKAPVGAMLKGVWRDLSEPFVRIFTGIAHTLGAMNEAKMQGGDAKDAGIAYLKGGVKAYKRVWLSAASYILPVAAFAVLMVTVYSVIGSNYSLRVTYNGGVIGFIENETVWESAQSLIKSRIKASDSTQEWSASPTFNVVSVDKAALSTASNLADTIVAQSPEKVQQASGLYVDGTLYTVVSESTELQQFLNSALDTAAAQSPDGRAEYVHKLETVPGLYFTDSIIKLSDAAQMLQNANLLQVKTIINSTYTQELEFETIEEENEKMYSGVKRVTQKGVNGTKEVNADIVYVDGAEVERRIISETVVKEATPKIVQVGTKQLAYSGSIGASGSGSLTFPVPGYSYITTEFGQGGHRGMDICAPYGTPIYACDSGTVVEAGSHYSWGNYIKIDHGNGTATLYAHCSALLVSAGQTVSRGDAIGLVGSTGASSGNHCHLEVYINGGLVNPRGYIF